MSRRSPVENTHCHKGRYRCCSSQRLSTPSHRTHCCELGQKKLHPVPFSGLFLHSIQLATALFLFCPEQLCLGLPIDSTFNHLVDTNESPIRSTNYRRVVYSAAIQPQPVYIRKMQKLPYLQDCVILLPNGLFLENHNLEAQSASPGTHKFGQLTATQGFFQCCTSQLWAS